MEVAVLASGRGSNFQSIIDASIRGEIPNANIKLLIVNKKKETHTIFLISKPKNIILLK